MSASLQVCANGVTAVVISLEVKVIDVPGSSESQGVHGGVAATGFDLSEYLPSSFVSRPDGISVRWIRASDTRFAESFVSQTEAAIVSNAVGNLYIETPAATLLERSQNRSAVAFIYHSSHCGSTLVANMLKHAPGCRVYSEPPVVTGLLDAIHRQLVPVKIGLSLLRATIAALTGGVSGTRSPVVFKMFSENIHQIDMVRQACPESPELFIYRDPVEILVGALRQPSHAWIWTQDYSGIPLHKAVELPVAEVFARVLGRNMNHMARSLEEQTALLNYADINRSLPTALCRWASVDPAATTIVSMQSALTFNAKAPDQRWCESDVALKRAQASDMVRALATRFVSEGFQQLQALLVRHAVLRPSGTERLSRTR